MSMETQPASPIPVHQIDDESDEGKSVKDESDDDRSVDDDRSNASPVPATPKYDKLRIYQYIHEFSNSPHSHVFYCLLIFFSKSTFLSLDKFTPLHKNKEKPFLRCTDCTTDEDKDEHRRLLREMHWQRWTERFSALYRSLHLLNTRISEPGQMFTTDAVGVPPPQICHACHRTSYFESLAQFRQNTFRSVAGYRRGTIPFHRSFKTPCISCVEEFSDYIHS